VNKRVLAWTIFAVGVASPVVAGWLAWLTRDAIASGTGWTGGSSLGEAALFSLAILPFPVVGLLIALRRPDNPIGWLLLAIGSVWFLGEAMSAYGTYGLAISRLPAADWVLGFTIMLWVPPVGLMGTFTLLLFPDGHLPSPRWRWFAWLCAGVLVVSSLAILLGTETLAEVGFPTLPNPWHVADLEVLIVAIFLFPLCILGSAASLVVRYRGAKGVERDQLKLLAFAAAVVAVSYLLVMLFSLASGDETPRWLAIAQTAIIFTFALIPIAIGVAILRHGLYDLEIVIKKTAMALVLTLLIGVPAILILAAASVPWLIWAVPNSAFTLVGGILLGVLAVPLVRVARRMANRIVYGTRATSYEVLTSFAGKVAETYSTDDVLPRMAQVLAAGTGAEIAAVWLRSDDRFHVTAVWPADARVPDAIPIDAVEVRHQGEVLGALSVEMPVNDPMTPSKQALIRDLASQAGLVLRNVRLIQDLRGSRRRIVTAQDERARKLERNIHDGAQQQLVALQVKLRLTDAVVDRDPAKAHELLGELQRESNDAIQTLRDLARGIYPPLLADKGLQTALEAQARKSPVPVAIRSDGTGRYTPEIEAAVYFSCLEALQNVAKYADASSVTVTLAQTDGSLAFEVRDDGHGFDATAASYGTGLQGIADRLAALGGEMQVSSEPGGGTTVAGRVPAEGPR
jgi:signal transduction histidine kinase